MERKLVVNGVDRWQLGYFVAELNRMMSNKNFELDKVDDCKLTIKFKKLSTIGELRLLGLVRKMSLNYVFKG